MFTWQNKQGVKSSKGFVLQSLDRYGYQYAEGSRTMRVDVEPQRNPSGEYSEEVSLKSISRWLPPHDNERIDQDKADAIRQNISDAMTFMQIEHTFN
jgi:hypothetical protein